MPQRRKKKISASLYTIAWFCVTDEEGALARASLDLLHEAPDFSTPSDGYYTYGEIQRQHDIHNTVAHNIVIIRSVESGKIAMGKASSQGPLQSSFPNLRLAFVVGIAAGLPTGRPPKDIYKGDVVVAAPVHGNDAVIEYDYAELHGDHNYRPKRHAENTASELRECFARWYEDYSDDDTAVQDILKSLVKRKEKFSAPNFDEDVLFRPENVHLNPLVRDCASCRETYHNHRIRPTRKEDGCYPLKVRKGLVLTGSSLIKSADARERIYQSFPEALCVDMESAVLMDTWHPLVVRGISDYGDSHYDWNWVWYASATASAVAKSIIRTLRVPDFVVNANQRRATAPSPSWFQNAPLTPPSPASRASSIDSATPPLADPMPQIVEQTGQSRSTTADAPQDVVPRDENATKSMSDRLIAISENPAMMLQAIALIESGADLTATDVYGNTVLHHSVKHQSTALTKKVLAKTPSTAGQANHQGRNPLHLCASDLTRDSVKHARLLIRAGMGCSWFDADVKDGVFKNGRTALEYTVAKYPTDHSKDMLLQLLTAGARPNPSRSMWQQYGKIQTDYERQHNGRRS